MTWILVLSLLSSEVATPEKLSCTVSWIGNTFPGTKDQWVQNFFIHTNVLPDGTVQTWSHWDEGGKRFGIYKDGQVIGNQEVPISSLVTKDQTGRTWRIDYQYVEAKFHEYDIRPTGITCDGQPVTFPGLDEPMALALANNGHLMVADSQTSPRQQILFYDIHDWQHPKLVKTFGEYGGIAAGTPGAVTPTKFWGIRGLGMDTAGNIYVSMSEMGSCLRQFSPTGELRWELRGDFFVDVVCADPTTDGIDVWGIQEHYRMDYNQSAGKEATLVGYSLCRHRYPDDPRGLTFVKQNGEHGLTSPQITYIDGKRFLFVGGMFASNFINIFRYEGEIAIPSSLIMQWEHGLYRTEQQWPPQRQTGTFIWRDRNGDGQYQAQEYAPNCLRSVPGPFWVDRHGNIWMAHGFFRYDCQGLDKQGNPIYDANHITVLDPPDGVQNITRVVYLDDCDTLIVAEQGENMRHIGQVYICPRYLAGNRATISFSPGAGKSAGCVAAAGDYIFTGGWQERGRVWVNRRHDGALVGILEPDETVGGVANTGWIDILTGITAFRRQNGEYFVFVEEDYKAKVLMYRWKPTNMGNGKP